MSFLDKVRWFVIGGIYSMTAYTAGHLTAQLF
jgi:hypothetical protein